MCVCVYASSLCVCDGFQSMLFWLVGIGLWFGSGQGERVRVVMSFIAATLRHTGTTRAVLVPLSKIRNHHRVCVYLCVTQHTGSYCVCNVSVFNACVCVRARRRVYVCVNVILCLPV